MAAGLSALSVTDILAGERAPLCGLDQSLHVRRFAHDRIVMKHRRGGAMFVGTAISGQKLAEIMFGDARTPCYLRLSMGAEGIVTNTSRRPN
ncbi:hypothetical protein [Bradyrhizobium cajani]|nr:hypothetical protein [Bradyrhizobium cajani]MCP3373673.1 hypothetical protein [Bradyrhizobium cajani]